ncbi:MAG: hypothetical protein NT018_05350 [Armatimonadetes bacterium]|nr:hypothetical protein [Armatimonadota bacterium]
MKNHYLCNWTFSILALLFGLCGSMASGAELTLTCTPMKATANSVFTYTAVWKTDPNKWVYPSKTAAVQTDGYGIVMLSGLGADDIPMYLYAVDVFAGTITFRASVSAGLNMSNPIQWPNQAGYTTPNDAVYASHFPVPTAQNPMNNLIWCPPAVYDGGMYPMWYASNLVNTIPHRATAYAFDLSQTPPALVSVNVDVTVVGVQHGGNATGSISYDGGLGGGGEDYLYYFNYILNPNYFYSPDYTSEPIDVGPKYARDSTHPNDGSSSNLFIFKACYQNGANLAPDGGIGGVVLYLQNLIDPYSAIVSPSYQDHGLFGDYKAFPMWKADDNAYNSVAGTNYVADFTPGYYTSGYSTKQNWAYNSLPIGIYSYFFGCSDDSMNFLSDGGTPLVLSMQPTPAEWAAGANIYGLNSPLLDPILSRTVIGYPEINRTAHRKFTDGVNWFDSTIFADRYVMAPGYFEGTAYTYPFTCTEHPRVTCQLTVPFVDALGVPKNDILKYGSGRFYGTLQPFKRCVNPLLDGAYTTGDTTYTGWGRSEFAGATTATENEFQILYRQLDNLPPTYMKVWINNASAYSKTAYSYTIIAGSGESTDRPAADYVYKSYPMVPDALVGSKPYFDGVWYRFKIKLPPGPHTYYFECYDGENKCIWPRRPDYAEYGYGDKRTGVSVDYYVSTMSMPNEVLNADYDNNDFVPGPYINTPPVLSESSVTPTSGKMGDTFKFRVKYADTDGQKPYSSYVYIRTNDTKAPQRFQLSPEAPIDPLVDNRAKYKTGVYYTCDVSTLEMDSIQTGTRKFYFEFIDDWGTHTLLSDQILGEMVIKTSDGQQWKDGPTISGPLAPTLTQGKLESSDDANNSATLYKFSVKYTDKNNDAPTVMKMFLGNLQPDGKTVLWDDGHNMLPEDSSDIVYTDGVIFYYQTRLSGKVFDDDQPKKYYYAFVAYDGTTWANYNNDLADPFYSPSSNVALNQLLTNAGSNLFTFVPKIANTPIMGPLPVELPAPAGIISDAIITDADKISVVNGISVLTNNDGSNPQPLLVDDRKSGKLLDIDDRYSITKGAATTVDREASTWYVMPDDSSVIASVEGVYTELDPANGKPIGINYYDPATIKISLSMTAAVDTGYDPNMYALLPLDATLIYRVIGVYTDFAMTEQNRLLTTTQLNADGRIIITDPAERPANSLVIYYVKYQPLTVTQTGVVDATGIAIDPSDPLLIGSVLGVFADQAKTIPLAGFSQLSVDKKITVANAQTVGITVYIDFQPVGNMDGLERMAGNPVNGIMDANSTITPDDPWRISEVLDVYKMNPNGTIGATIPNIIYQNGQINVGEMKSIWAFADSSDPTGQTYTFGGVPQPVTVDAAADNPTITLDALLQANIDTFSGLYSDAALQNAIANAAYDDVTGVITITEAAGAHVPGDTAYVAYLQNMSQIVTVDVSGGGLLITLTPAQAANINTFVALYSDAAMTQQIISATYDPATGIITIADPLEKLTGTMAYITYKQMMNQQVWVDAYVTLSAPVKADVVTFLSLFVNATLTQQIPGTTYNSVDGVIKIAQSRILVAGDSAIMVYVPVSFILPPIGKIGKSYTDATMTTRIVSAALSMLSNDKIYIYDRAEYLDLTAAARLGGAIYVRYQDASQVGYAGDVWIEYNRSGYWLGNPTIWLTKELPVDTGTVYIKYHDSRFNHQVRGYCNKTNILPDGATATPVNVHIKDDIGDVTGGVLGVWLDKEQTSPNYFNPFLTTYSVAQTMQITAANQGLLLSFEEPSYGANSYIRYYQLGNYRIDRWTADNNLAKVQFLAAPPAGKKRYATYVFGTPMQDKNGNNILIGENTPPELSVGKVTPRYGARNTTYTYSVVYKDTDGPNGQAPDPEYGVCVYIDGVPFKMTLDATGGSPIYRLGVLYTYTTLTNLTGGSHKFRFDTSDGVSAFVYDWYTDAPGRVRPTTGVDMIKDIDGPWVNDLPTLTLGMAIPNPAAPGTIGTNQTVDYTVVYTDLDNEPPFEFNKDLLFDKVGEDIIGLPRLWVDYATSADALTAGRVDGLIADSMEPTKKREMTVSVVTTGRVDPNTAGGLIILTNDPAVIGKTILGVYTDPELTTKIASAGQVDANGKIIISNLADAQPLSAMVYINYSPLWRVDQFKNKLMQVTNGTLASRTCLIHSNTANTLTIATNDLVTDGFSATPGSKTTFRINGIVMSKLNAEDQDFTKGIKYKITVSKLAVGTHNFHFTARSRVVIPVWCKDDVMTGVVDATGFIITPLAPLKIGSINGVYPDLMSAENKDANVKITSAGQLNALGKIAIGNIVDKQVAGTIVYINYEMAQYSDEVRDPLTGKYAGPTVVLVPPTGNKPPVLGGDQVLSGPFGKRADIITNTQVKLNTGTNWTVLEADSVRYVMGVYLNASLDSNASVNKTNYLTTSVGVLTSPYTVDLTAALPAVADGATMVQIGVPDGNSLLRVVPDALGAIATVTGVYLNTALTGTNYYGSISGGKIVMSQQLPSGTQQVYIKYTKKAGVALTQLPVYIKYLRAKPLAPAKFPFGDPLTLRANYSDPDSDPPTLHDGVTGYMNFVMGNPATATPMVAVPPIVGNYILPRPFELAFAAAPAGVTKFHYEASDGYDLVDPLTTHFVRYPLLAANDFSFDVNSKPLITAGTLMPSISNPITDIVFRVHYSDADGIGTTPIVRVRLCRIGGTLEEFVYSMTTTGTDFVAGVDYSLTMLRSGIPLVADGTYSIIFEATDGTQFGDPFIVGATDIPLHNVAPVIVSTNVTPRAGKLATPFVYQARYRDADNDAPIATLAGQTFAGLILVIDKGTSLERKIRMTKSDPAQNDFTVAGGVLYENAPGITMNQFGSIEHSYEVQASDGLLSAAPKGESNVPIHLIPSFEQIRVVSANAANPDTADGLTTASVGDNVLIVGLIKFPKNNAYPKPVSDVPGSDPVSLISFKITKPDGSVIPLVGFLTIQPDATDPIYWIGKIKVSSYPEDVDPALVTGDALTLCDGGEWKFGAARISDAADVWDSVETDTVIDGKNDSFKLLVGGPMIVMAVSDPTTPATSTPLVDMITPAMVIADGDVGRIFGYDWAAQMQIVRWDPTTRIYFRYGSGSFPQLNPGDAVWIKPMISYSAETATQVSIDTGLLTAPAGIALVGNRQYRMIHSLSKGYPTQKNATSGLTELAPCVIPLYSGWNQFGNIFINWKKDASNNPVSPRQDVGIPFSELRVRYLNEELSIADARLAGWIRDYAWRFDAPTRCYVLVNATEPGVERVIKAWSGFWIRAFVDCDLVIDPNTSYNGGVISTTSVNSLAGTSMNSFDTPPPVPSGE